LSISQSFIFQKLNGSLPSQNDTLALAHFCKALRAANEMMKDSLQHKSDEMLVTVASLMCHHVGNALLRLVSKS
jgi:hypothetical protein